MPRLCAPTMTFSSSVIDGNRARFWNVRAMPWSAMPCGGTPQQVGAVEVESAGRRLVDPADDVEHRRLARAVGSDQPADLTLVDRERQTVERNDATEAHGDVLHIEQCHACVLRGGRIVLSGIGHAGCGVRWIGTCHDNEHAKSLLSDLRNGDRAPTTSSSIGVSPEVAMSRGPGTFTTCDDRATLLRCTTGVERRRLSVVSTSRSRNMLSSRFMRFIESPLQSFGPSELVARPGVGTSTLVTARR